MAPYCRPSLSRWSPTRKEALDLIIKHVVAQKAKHYPKQPNKKVIVQLCSDKATYQWDRAYIERRARYRFYEEFFQEYDTYICPSGRKEKDRYIWRCLLQAAHVTEKDLESLLLEC